MQLWASRPVTKTVQIGRPRAIRSPERGMSARAESRSQRRVAGGVTSGRAKTIAGKGEGENYAAWSTRTPVRILTGADSRRLVELELGRLDES